MSDRGELPMSEEKYYVNLLSEENNERVKVISNERGNFDSFFVFYQLIVRCRSPPFINL